MEIDPETLEIEQTWSSLIDPEIPIEPGAQAIHGISSAMLECEPTIEEFVQVILGGRIEEPCTLIGHNCLTGDHEILTEAGWARLDEVRGDLVEAAVWDPKTSEVTFSSSEVLRFPYDGPMLAWDTSRHCGVYTPDHRVYAKIAARLPGPWEVLTAKEAAGKSPNSLYIPCAGHYDPDHPLMLDAAQARVLEMVRADGHIGRVSGAPRFRFKKARKVARCLALLDAVGTRYKLRLDRRGVTSISTYQDALMDYVTALLGRGREKALGRWVLSMSYSARDAMLDEAAFWDGREGARKEGNGLVTVASAKASDAEWLATAAVVTGRFASVTLDLPNVRGFSRSDSVISRVSYRRKLHVKTLEAPAEVAYSGQVYCLRTSTGAFMVRRKGKVWVTGNCSFDKPFFEPVMNVVKTYCTLGLSRRMFPTGPENHKLGTMKDYLKLEGGEAHRALGDVHTVHQMLRLLIPQTGRSLLDLLQVPAHTIYTMPWGEHAGKQLSDIPVSYRTWLLSVNIDEDLRRSLMQLRSAGI